MVDIVEKKHTLRQAIARSIVYLPPNVADALSVTKALHRNSYEIQTKKGPVFTTAIISGTMAAKNTANIIPFCHQLPIESIKFDIQFHDTYPSSQLNDDPKDALHHNDVSCDVTRKNGVYVAIDCSIKCTYKTGVEMEALTGASVASLTVYDMCKALSHDIIIKDTRLLSKTGGKSDFM